MRERTRRALIAALIGAIGTPLFVAGLGHIYLREWRRGVAWFTFVLGSLLVLISVFADPSTASVDSLPLTVVTPLLALLSASILDAYYLGHRGPLDYREPDTVRCPHCGGGVDPELQFCHWCSEPLSVAPPVDVR